MPNESSSLRKHSPLTLTPPFGRLRRTMKPAARVYSGWVGSVLLLSSSIFLSVAAKGGSPQATGPNIVLILTDDQRWDTLWAMPQVQSELDARGVTFSNSFVVDSLCCPSRAFILTGEYSHTTGIYKNESPNGGFGSFQDPSTIATWLHDDG